MMLKTTDHGPEVPANQAADRLHLLAIYIGGAVIGLDATSVREIRQWTPPTPVSPSPAHMEGVVPLRGGSVLVVDLATQLGLPTIDQTANPVLVIVAVAGRLEAIIADAVSGLIAIPRSAVQAPPASASPVIVGSCADGDRTVTIIDPSLMLDHTLLAAAA